ncbi:efflux RND transporter periplasmic adaptor subunit [Entomomonas moraniae]|uniref:Efflux RND transporter periplasmic adaptor subunit n=2 Tax=Entomomonas moraniae TaxID=2213226 RepID=A0A3Q9JLN1_9GAMM|nr:efflux RND transporter periplasmic adaptor subunit [Entomomonas moraniae]
MYMATKNSHTMITTITQHKKWFVTIFIIIISSYFIFLKMHVSPKATTVTTTPVNVVQVKASDVPIWLQAIGSVKAINTVMIKVRADGELQKTYFEEGNTVKKGDLLAEIDPQIYQAQLDQAKSVAAKDKAQLNNALISYNRASKLAQAGAGPSQDVNTYRAQVATLKATIEADQAAIDEAQIQLNFTQIKSPIDGRAGQRLIDVGSIVHASDNTGLVTITQMDPISIQFTVPQNNLAAILLANQKNNVEVIALQPNTDKSIAIGKLTFIDSQVSSNSGQVTLKANFDNKQQNLWPGTLISVKLLLRTDKETLIIPAQAIQQGNEGPFVYVIDKDQKAHVRNVELGAAMGDLRQVTKGLQLTDQVVTSGQYRLTEGSVVNIVKQDNVAVKVGQ